MTSQTSRKRILTVCLGLAAACLVVFGAVLRHSFLNFDDGAYVSENLWVRSGFTRAGVVWAFTAVDDFYWQPLTWLSHMLDCQLFGLQAGWHHLTNLLLHAANAVLVFLVFRRLTGAFWRSAALAALFALHPLRVETVAWVAERNDVLSVFWFLVTLWVYHWHSQRPGSVRYVLLLAALVLGLMSKPTLVTAPVLLLLLDWWPLRRRAFPEKLPVLPLAAVSSFITYVGIRRLGSVNWGATIPFPHRIANALISYVKYLELTFWPHDLALPYPYPMLIPWWQTLGAVVLLAALTVAALWFGRRRPYLAVGWLWFVVGLIPAIGLVQVGRQGMADRFTYLPCLGLGMAVVWGGAELLQNRRVVAMSLVASAVVGCAVASWRQVAFWQDSLTLFSHTVRVTRHNASGERQLGLALLTEGRFAEALPHYAAVLQIEPSYFLAQNEYGIVLEHQGDLQGAAEHYRAALKYWPQYEAARDDLYRLEHHDPISAASPR